MTTRNGQHKDYDTPSTAAVDALNAEAWAHRMGNPERTAELALEARRLSGEIGYRRGIVASVRNLAASHLMRSDYTTANDLAEEARSAAVEEGERVEEAYALNVLAWAQYRLANIEESTALHIRSIELAKERPDIEASALRGMGQIRNMLGDTGGALDFLARSLDLTIAIGDRAEEACVLLAVGNIRERCGSYAEALDLYTRCLEIAREISNIRLEAYASGNIGTVHERIGSNAESLAHNLRSLELKKLIDDRWGMGVSYNNIAVIYASLGEYPSAMEAHLGSLRITEEIGDREGMSVALNGVGQMYQALGDRVRAMEYFTRSLGISRQIGYSRGEAFSLNHVGRCYESAGDHARALLHYVRSLRILEGLGDTYGTGWVLTAIGDLHGALGDHSRAADYYRRCLDISAGSGDRQVEVTALLALGTLQGGLGEYPIAIELLEQGLALSAETGNRDQEAKIFASLAEVHASAGHGRRSAYYRGRHQERMQEMFNERSAGRVRDILVRLEQNELARQGEELGLEEGDVSEVGAAVRRWSSARIAAALAGISESDPQSSSGTIAPAARVAEIVVVTFGEFRVKLPGGELSKGDWKRKKARDLFKLLLINHRRALTVDEIMEKLWGAGGGTELLVMNAVSHVRAALEPARDPHAPSRYLTSSDRAYTLDLGENAMIDFLRFKEMIVYARRSATAEERVRLYSDAAALYGGDFLKEDAFEEWTTSERDLLKDAYLEAMEYVAAEHLRRGAVELAGDTARRILECDDTSERAYEILMLALRERGRRGEIRNVFERCRRAFLSDQGTEPPSRLRQIAYPD